MVDGIIVPPLPTNYAVNGTFRGWSGGSEGGKGVSYWEVGGSSPPVAWWVESAWVDDGNVHLFKETSTCFPVTDDDDWGREWGWKGILEVFYDLILYSFFKFQIDIKEWADVFLETKRLLFHVSKHPLLMPSHYQPPTIDCNQLHKVIDTHRPPALSSSSNTQRRNENKWSYLLEIQSLRQIVWSQSTPYSVRCFI